MQERYFVDCVLWHEPDAEDAYPYFVADNECIWTSKALFTYYYATQAEAEKVCQDMNRGYCQLGAIIDNAENKFGKNEFEVEAKFAWQGE